MSLIISCEMGIPFYGNNHCSLSNTAEGSLGVLQMPPLLPRIILTFPECKEGWLEESDHSYSQIPRVVERTFIEVSLGKFSGLLKKSLGEAALPCGKQSGKDR